LARRGCKPAFRRIDVLWCGRNSRDRGHGWLARGGDLTWYRDFRPLECERRFTESAHVPFDCFLSYLRVRRLEGRLKAFPPRLLLESHQTRYHREPLIGRLGDRRHRLPQPPKRARNGTPAIVPVPAVVVT